MFTVTTVGRTELWRTAPGVERITMPGPWAWHGRATRTRARRRSSGLLERGGSLAPYQLHERGKWQGRGGRRKAKQTPSNGSWKTLERKTLGRPPCRRGVWAQRMLQRGAAGSTITREPRAAVMARFVSSHGLQDQAQLNEWAKEAKKRWKGKGKMRRVASATTQTSKKAQKGLQSERRHGS